MSRPKSGGNSGRFQKGADARRGKGPPKGQGGRPPDEFLAMCQSLASNDEVLAQVKVILANPDHAQFMRALQWAADRGYGKAPETVDVTSKGEKIGEQHWVIGGRTLKLA